MNADQLQQLKAACEGAMRRTVTIDTDRYLKLNPRTILDLIAEVERLREYVMNYTPDMRDEHYR